MRDAAHKLSKREGDPTYEDLLAAGYLREAVINYIALLGWSPRSEREVFSLDELVEHFSIDGLSKSPAVFDIQKLAWLNGEYIRALPAEAFHAAALPYIRQTVKGSVDTAALALLLQKRCAKLSDIPEQVDFIDAVPPHDISLYTHKKMKTDTGISQSSLQAAKPVLEALQPWTEDALREGLEALAESMGLKNGQMLYPLRTALSGKAFTPGGACELAALLGREETLRRIGSALAAFPS
jgi:glutamyl-tRNA synthetase